MSDTMARSPTGRESPTDGDDLTGTIRVMSTASVSTSGGAFVTLPGQGDSFAVAGDVVTIKIRGGETGGAFCLVEIRVPPGGGPPPHVHRREAESFYVLEGEITFLHSAGPTRISKGGFVHLPKNVPHCFRNETSNEARMLVWCHPAGFESMVERAGIPMASPEAPIPARTPEHLEHLRAVCLDCEIPFVDHF